MVLDFDLDICFHLRSVIQLFLGLCGSVGPIIFKRVLSVVVWITSCVPWEIYSRPMHTATSTSALAVTFAISILQGFVFFNDLVPDRHIFAFNDMHDQSGFFH